MCMYNFTKCICIFYHFFPFNVDKVFLIQAYFSETHQLSSILKLRQLFLFSVQLLLFYPFLCNQTAYFFLYHCLRFSLMDYSYNIVLDFHIDVICKLCAYLNLKVQLIPWRRKWLPSPGFLPGEFHSQRSLVGNIPWGCKESDMTKT